MKKVLALTLALVLALSMSTVAFAASYNTYDKDDWQGALNFTDAAGKILADDIDNDLDMQPGDDFDDLYIWDGTWNTNGTALTGTAATTDIRAFNNIDVKVTFTKGGQVYDDYELTNGRVKIIFKDNVLTTKDIDFKFTVAAVIDGKAMTKGIVKYEGTYDITVEKSDNDWFDFEGGEVLEPTAFVREMEYIFSDDISVYGRALKGVLYKGIVSSDPNDADEELMVEHPAIVGVYHLSDINISAVATHVAFNNDDSSLFVYDGDFNLLGKVGDKTIPYANTYYLAVSELAVDTDEEAPDDFDDEEEYEPGDIGGNSSTGGDDLYPENPHDNPGTGK